MRESRLHTVVSIAEIVSALAVVATLIYAVGELKRSRALASTDIETILYDRMLEMDRLVVESEGMADIVRRAREDTTSLTPAERTRYLAWEHIFFDAWEAAIDASQNELIDPASFASWDEFFTADAARRPKLAWTGNLRYYGPEFIEYVESRVRWQE